MEAEKAAMHESSSDEGGIADVDLLAACKKVKGKITSIKQRSKMKNKPFSSVDANKFYYL